MVLSREASCAGAKEAVQPGRDSKQPGLAALSSQAALMAQIQLGPFWFSLGWTQPLPVGSVYSEGNAALQQSARES